VAEPHNIGATLSAVTELVCQNNAVVNDDQSAWSKIPGIERHLQRLKNFD
jgi:hypothetical protein